MKFHFLPEQYWGGDVPVPPSPHYALVCFRKPRDGRAVDRSVTKQKGGGHSNFRSGSSYIIHFCDTVCMYQLIVSHFTKYAEYPRARYRQLFRLIDYISIYLSNLSHLFFYFICLFIFHAAPMNDSSLFFFILYRQFVCFSIQFFSRTKYVTFSRC